MNKKLILFGTGLLGEMADYYFGHDSEYEIKAFITDDNFYKEGGFCGKPVVPFSKMTNAFPPSEYDLFVAIGYTDLNRNRERVFIKCKELGYSLVSYVNSKATIYDTLKLGENCFIFENVTIQPYAAIGDDVIIWNGSNISHRAVIEDHCFISSNVVVAGGAYVGRNCFIGMHSAIRDYVNIGEHCLIGAGSWINKDTAPYGLYSNEGTHRIRELK